MSLQTLPPAARWYVRTVIGLGTAGLVAAAAHARVLWSPALAVAMLAAAALASQKLLLIGATGHPGSRTHRMSTLSLGFPVVLGSVIGFGLGGGMLVAVASAVGAGLFPRRHPFYRIWFTSVNLGAAALASGCVMQVLDAPLGRFQPVPGRALLAGSLVYYLVNSGMVGAAVALSERASLWTTWRSSYLWTTPSFLAGAAVVAGAGFLRAQCGDAVASLSLFCLLLIYYSYRGYLDRLHQLQVSEQRLQEVCVAAVESMALAIDAKDGFAHSHARRVQQIALALADRAEVTESERQAIRLASLTHDVGKLAVPDTILAKAGRLTPDEYERMKQHVQVGVSILEPVQYPWPVVDIVRTHHERWDGQGYPAGLKGEEIPIGGRIVAIADVFAALTAPRAYRPAMSCDEAHALLREGRGTQFDPRLIDLFSAIYPVVAVALAASDATGAAEGAELAATLPNAARRAWTEIREANQEARSAAFTDALTGLANARHLAAALPRELETTQRSGGSLSVLMIDLDGFKAINDGHGHLQGDAALQTVACLLRECVRDGTTVCRYAGDEFVLVLPATAREQAARVANRLRERVDGCRVPGTELRIGLSIGIASFPRDGTDARALLDAADKQMYADKSHRKRPSSAPSPRPANIS